MNFLSQGIKFIGLSGVGWILDFVVFNLLGAFSDSLVLNNVISSWVGVTFVFAFASRNIFSNSKRVPIPIKYGIYLVYQCMLIYFISQLLAEVSGYLLTMDFLGNYGRFSGAVAKIAVTPVTMICNFIVMKLVVERL